MPAHNLIPILFPKPKQDNIYNMFKTLMDIREREIAIEQGGDIENPDSYDEIIEKYEAKVKDPNLSGKERLDAQKEVKGYELKKVKTALARKKEISEKGMDWALTQDLRNVEFSLPENPWAFAQEAQIQIKRLLEGEGEVKGLNQNIETLMEYGETKVDKLEEYRDKLQYEELDKYARIQRAFEEKDYDLLSRYGIVYSPFYKGKAKNVRIVELGSGDYGKKTNLKFSVDEGGNLITSTKQGMTMCFDGTALSAGEKVNFAGIEFDYLGEMGFEANNPESFNWQNIRHSTIGDVKAGMFAEDSHKRLFYVNRDFTMSPIRSERWKERLGFSEDKVYKLSPREELNTLPGTISSSTAISEWLEQYNRQTEMSDFNNWETEKELPSPEPSKESTPLTIAEREGKIMPKTLETKAKVKLPIEQTESSTKWRQEETKPLTVFEEGKKFIQKITP